jgi:hypothetical protein
MSKIAFKKQNGEINSSLIYEIPLFESKSRFVGSSK